MNTKNDDLALKVTNLGKEFPGRKAVDSISFSVEKGTIHGFLGPNGAGKSTTMRILTGLLAKSEGEFIVNGRIGFLPEIPPLYENMTVDDYLSFIFEIQTNQKKNENVQKIKSKCGLESVGSRIIGNLSKGFKQRVAIAGALVSNPEIIILDEPTVGLDPNAILEIRSLISELKKEHTILFSSHQLHEVEHLCTHITLIHQGKILFTGEKEAMLKIFSKRFEYLLKTNQNLPDKLKALSNQFQFEFNLMTAQGEQSFDWIIGPKENWSGQKIAEVTKAISESGMGLIGFQEKKLDLEEVFKMMTRNNE